MQNAFEDGNPAQGYILQGYTEHIVARSVPRARAAPPARARAGRAPGPVAAVGPSRPRHWQLRYCTYSRAESKWGPAVTLERAEGLDIGRPSDSTS